MISTKHYFVYIIQNKDNGKIYTGFTSDLDNRLRQHNENISGYTKNKGPWKVVWFAGFESKILAEQFERYLKSGSGIAFSRKRFLGK